MCVKLKSEFRVVTMLVGDGWLSGGGGEKERVQIGREGGVGPPDELLPHPVLNAAPVH